MFTARVRLRFSQNCIRNKPCILTFKYCKFYSTTPQQQEENASNRSEQEESIIIEKPPEPPGNCCGNGCENCVWEAYWPKLDAYNMKIADLEKKKNMKK